MTTMNNFYDVLKQVRKCIPKYAHSRCYTVKDNPDCLVKISAPNDFDAYGDVVARVTLLYKDKVILDNLITYNSDLTRFCEKLKRKIKECSYGNK